MALPNNGHYETESEPEEVSASRETQLTPAPHAESEANSATSVPQTPSQELHAGGSIPAGSGQVPVAPLPAPPAPWIWYSELVENWVTLGQVPSPYASGSATAPRLPPLNYPIEQVLAAVVARLNQENGQLRQSCALLTHGLQRAESQISYLMETVGRLDHNQHAIRDRHREITDEILNLRARTHPPPFGMSNQELSHRVDTLEYQHNTFAGVAGGHFDQIDNRLATLDIRADDIEAELQANQMAAMINPPPEEVEGESEEEEDAGEDDEADAQSDIDDAMEP